MNRRCGDSMEKVVAGVALGPPGLTQYDWPGGVAISYLFDGNENRRQTCQWRVIAPNAEVLLAAVKELTDALNRAGVKYDPPQDRRSYLSFPGLWSLADHFAR